MPPISRFLLFGLLAVSLASPSLPAQVPQLLNYQGRVAVGGSNFQGAGKFRFALVDGTGTTSYWSNDGTSNAGSTPASAVTLTVSNGLYTVLLGDTALPNMTAIPPAVFNNPHVRLRVWFDDGSNGVQQLAPDQRIAAVGYAVISGNVADGAITTAKLAPGAVTAGNIAAGTITSTQMATGAAAANLAAGGQSGVASGGLILGASANSPELAAAGYVYFGAVNVGDVWNQRSSTGAPSARYRQSAVWTGSELIVWGGVVGGTTTTYLADGGRYTPATDSWTSIPSGGGAPLARAYHTAVWSGSEMIVWGGYTSGDVLTASGARYNPVTSTWSSVATGNAPSARRYHTAVWTGSEMIVWGGSAATGPVEDGARYTPGTNTWATLPLISPGNPMPRTKHAAVWTGTEMIVWGGSTSSTSIIPVVATGARYHRGNNNWSQVSTASAPSARALPAAVWTGTEMIVWGGAYGSLFLGNEVPNALNDGFRYLPSGNSWTPMLGTPPTGRYETAAIWTGTVFVVWGGGPADGGVYSPARNNWQPVTLTNAPISRLLASFVWTGTQGLFFGGADPALSPAATNEIWDYTPPRNLHLYARP